ncbi:hypothetical protein NUW54_g5563 [Trametes sanguinea]|uniref:Uncharacterized protein n=1 Tax=Trametes sanguinea TaxID=158606 RepID=A0ACC1PXA4_9APHY|nr:hypothetical protein NUW54_g5563 [Trametes sanguinea]
MDPYRASASAYAPSTAMFAQAAPPSATGSQFSAFPPAAPFVDNRGSFQQDGSVASWEQDGTVTSSMRRKAAAAGVSPYAPSTRFILHTDIEDDPPPPPEDEVIELPPQYTPRRAPPAPLAGMSSPGASGSGAGGGYGQPPSSELPPPPSPELIHCLPRRPGVPLGSQLLRTLRALNTRPLGHASLIASVASSLILRPRQ